MRMFGTLNTLFVMKRISCSMKCSSAWHVYGINNTQFFRNAYFFKRDLNSHIEGNCIRNRSARYFSSDQQPEWTIIYRFRPIVLVYILCRLKIYQTSFTIATVPTSGVLYYFGNISLSALQTVCTVSAVACSTLILFTHYFRRLVGLLYISKDKKFIKLAHLTFWGRRNDFIIPVNDIVPLSEGTCRASDIYMLLKRYSTNQNMYLSLRFGTILQKEDFFEVFGSLDAL